MNEKAKKQAIEDIKNDLRKENKCFLAFRKELNPKISYIVSAFISKQVNKK